MTSPNPGPRRVHAPVLLPPMPPLRSIFTDTRWHVLCVGRHHYRRRGWPLQTWRDRLSLTGSLVHLERRA